MFRNSLLHTNNLNWHSNGLGKNVLPYWRRVPCYRHVPAILKKRIPVSVPQDGTHVPATYLAMFWWLSVVWIEFHFGFPRRSPLHGYNVSFGTLDLYGFCSIRGRHISTLEPSMLSRLGRQTWPPALCYMVSISGLKVLRRYEQGRSSCQMQANTTLYSVLSDATETVISMVMLA